MAIRTGKVIMAKNIRLDKSYKNVLSYSESQMVTLITNNAVQSFTNCSFIRPGENAIKLEMTYNNALKCNYLAFQNPDYSNKWFFAFIDEVEYVSEKTVIVRYTIDEFHTWYDYWQPDLCFVEREHTNNDTPGNNLIPERLELGEYVANGDIQAVSYGITGGRIIAMCAPYEPDGTGWEAVMVNGIPVSGCLTFYTDIMSLSVALRVYATHAQVDTISSVFLVPADIIDDNRITEKTSADNYKYYVWEGHGSVEQKDFHIHARYTSLNGYTPVNQKMLTAPFQGLLLHNNAGSSNFIGYEYFSNPSDPVIRCQGTMTVGGSIISFPLNYKGKPSNILEGISCGKLPTLSWSADVYTNWLTQNAVNIGMGLAGGMFSMMIGGMGAVAGSASAGEAIGGGVHDVANILGEMYQHSLAPVVSRGNVNQGDVMSASGVNLVYAQPMSITAQYAERIDKYFTRFGYQTNLVKMPNQVGRRYWNFVKIAPGEDIGHSTANDYFSVPASSMEAINQIYRNGVTIWHDHANVGNFSLSNTIVS